MKPIPTSYKPMLQTLKRIETIKYEYLNGKHMEPKKKFNWTRLWQIIRDIILAALTADSVRNL